MNHTDPRIDTYIKKAAPFAQPILTHFRSLVHKACPEVQETIKWGMPFFDYKGTFCNMASFKEHCSFGFWKAALMKDSNKLKSNQEEGMGHLGKIKAMADLPADKIMLGYLKEAKKLNDDGIKMPARKITTASETVVPEKLIKALKGNKKAKATFESFSPSQRKEYVQWIAEAKTEDTRDKRIATTVAWLEEGKKRNWKYER